MREILFRGKREDSGEWVYGGFTPDAIGHPRITVKDGNGLLFHKVVPETVGQYTGINDAEGNRIFEGDCIFLDEWEAGGVVYFDSCWLFRFHDGSGPVSLKRRCKECGVVGNVWDNPELLGNEA
jgi:hypothetical protein